MKNVPETIWLMKRSDEQCFTDILFNEKKAMENVLEAQ
jgi:hypothetical protein